MNTTARTRSIPTSVIALGVTGVLLITLVLGVVWKVGPSYGVWLIPPSPQEYAEHALDSMEGGYWASGPEWEQARAKAEREVEGAESYGETLPALRKALVVAGGKHSKLFDEGESLGTVDSSTPLPQVKSANGITTVTLPRQNAEDEAFKSQYAEQLASGIAKSQGATSCGWVVDLRGNTGGDMGPMLAGLNPLLGDGEVAGFKGRGGKQSVTLEGGAVKIDGRSVMEAPGHSKVSGPVAVLQGPKTASSGEVVVLAFRGADQARSFGAKSAGYATANQSMTLYDGTQMLLTTAITTDRDGQGNGAAITPDVTTSSDAAEVKAHQWLQSQCGKK